MTIEELEAEVKALKSQVTTLTGEKENVEVQLGKVNKKNSELLGEKKKYQQVQAVLTELGVEVDDVDAFRENLTALIEPDENRDKSKKTNLPEALKRQIDALKKENEDSKSALLGEQIQTKLITQLSAIKDLASPAQMKALLGGKLSIDESGNLMVSDNGLEVGFGKYMDGLRANPDYQNQFMSKTKPGMGSEGAGGAGGESGKAWKDMTMTERAIAANENPDRVKAELNDAGLGAFIT